MLFYDEQDLISEESDLWADQREGLLNFTYF